MKVETLLSELGVFLGLNKLSFNENGVCSLVFNELINVHIEPDGESKLYIYSPICELPQDIKDREKLLSVLFEAQLFGKGTQMLHFGLDAEENKIYLWKVIENADTGKEIRDMIEVFCNVFDAWEHQIKMISTKPDASTESDGTKDVDFSNGQFPGAIRV